MSIERDSNRERTVNAAEQGNFGDIVSTTLRSHQAIISQSRQIDFARFGVFVQ